MRVLIDLTLVPLLHNDRVKDLGLLCTRAYTHAQFDVPVCRDKSFSLKPVEELETTKLEKGKQECRFRNFVFFGYPF